MAQSSGFDYKPDIQKITRAVNDLFLKELELSGLGEDGPHRATLVLAFQMAVAQQAVSVAAAYGIEINHFHHAFRDMTTELYIQTKMAMAKAGVASMSDDAKGGVQ